MSEEAPTIVIDNGSGMIKAGIAGEEAPRAVFPTIVGRPKNAQAKQGVAYKEEWIGDEAIQKKGILNLSYPISAGVVESWEDMEKVWNHIFYNELRVNPSEAEGVFLTDTDSSPKENKERMT